MSETTYPTPAYTLSTATAPPALDVLDILPDEERQILKAWRESQKENRKGNGGIMAAKVKGKVMVWISRGAGLVSVE